MRGDLPPQPSLMCMIGLRLNKPLEFRSPLSGERNVSRCIPPRGILGKRKYTHLKDLLFGENPGGDIWGK